MKAIICLETNQWIKTSDPVVAVDSSLRQDHLAALSTALTAGVPADPEPGRSGFYDVVIGGRWFYIHIPRNLPRVYVISSFEIVA